MQQKIASFADVHRMLESWTGSGPSHSYNLEHMHELLEYLGNPHKRFKVVHVAGTSGKTSTAYYAAALLMAAGKKVGLTVSPHVDEVNERVQIGLRPMPEAEFCRRFSEFLELLKGCRVTPNYPSLFIAFALWEFASRGVDCAVVEVKVGGLLDSTNVFEDPEKICIITDIGYDHMDLLGNTLTEIAGQKAGVIKLHNAVFCRQQAKEVMDVIGAQAVQKQADLHTLTSDSLDESLDFLPKFQRRNFGLSLAAVQFALEREGVPALSKELMLQAARTHIPARMEVVQFQGKTLILDGAHNAQKLRALVESIKDQYAGQPIAALVGLAAKREFMVTDVAGEMSRLAGHFVVTDFEASDQGDDSSAAASELAAALHAKGAQSVEKVGSAGTAFHRLMQRPEPVLVVAGSFYLLNHIRPLLKDYTGGSFSPGPDVSVGASRSSSTTSWSSTGSNLS